jgi:hypothetical protein
VLAADRLIYDELREATQPVTTREPAERIMRVMQAAASRQSCPCHDASCAAEREMEGPLALPAGK